jgi:hypothetical protein
MGKSSVGYGIDSLSRFMAKALLTIIYKSSVASTNKRGDRGSPYRTPHLHLKNLPGTPLSSTTDEPDERMA